MHLCLPEKQTNKTTHTHKTWRPHLLLHTDTAISLTILEWPNFQSIYLDHACLGASVLMTRAKTETREEASQVWEQAQWVPDLLLSEKVLPEGTDFRKLPLAGWICF